MAADRASLDRQTSGTRVFRGRLCGGDLWRGSRQSEGSTTGARCLDVRTKWTRRDIGTVDESISTRTFRACETAPRHPFRWLPIALRSIDRHRAPVSARAVHDL